ncbi:DUF4294 domain-containing protein [Aquimarina agarivorans]|uniref:DUF4294 domain-containing protein n=1 Tax=Aquimarina agarivorans TaxID=980584 RepID=UPI000248F8F1|nr:DUF4294 domain-containing protein [Aquimarina agarivorans]
MKQFLIFNIFLFLSFSVTSQVKDVPSYTPKNKQETNEDERLLFMIEGDSTASESIPLNEIVILPNIKFDSSLKRKKYLILARKTKKVYPYAKMAADTLSKLVVELETIKKKRHRKKYIKRMQRFMEERFTKELKKFSRTEGQILIKLVHRQTGRTMFDLIKNYRSGWKAFWYEKTAHLFNISLKREFDPTNVYEDYLIEDILERSFQNDVLVRQPPAVKFNLFELIDKWKTHDPTPVH